MAQTTFHTKDIGEAAVLFCHRIELVEVTVTNGKCYLHFYPYDSAQELVNRYWQHQVAVDAQDFFHALNRIKKIVYESKGDNYGR